MASAAPRLATLAEHRRRGSRPGERRGGRQKGTPNKATPEVKAAIKELIESGIQPLEVILRVMRGDETVTDRQFAAAQAAAPYVHPRLASTTMQARVSLLDSLTLDEQHALLAALDALDTAQNGPTGGDANAAPIQTRKAA